MDLILGLGRSLEKKMATHSRILAWRIPQTEEPGRLQSMGSQRVGHDWSDLAHCCNASQLALVVKNTSANAEDLRDASSIPGLGRSLEKKMATHSSILAWRIPRTEEPGGLQSMCSERVGHNLATEQEQPNARFTLYWVFLLYLIQTSKNFII